MWQYPGRLWCNGEMLSVISPPTTRHLTLTCAEFVLVSAIIVSSSSQILSSDFRQCIAVEPLKISNLKHGSKNENDRYYHCIAPYSSSMWSIAISSVVSRYTSFIIINDSWVWNLWDNSSYFWKNCSFSSNELNIILGTYGGGGGGCCLVLYYYNCQSICHGI